MAHRDDETRTAKGSSDPALDETLRATPSDSSSATAESSATREAGSKIGRYKVLGVLGRGGMGIVYRANDPDLGRELAIKVVLPGSGSDRAQARLLAEARAMAKLRHPSVVPVFDVGTTANGVFIAMPLIKGGTMYEWMREPRPWKDVVERFVAAGRGLAAAHAAGLIHRDFKPRNVLLGEEGEVLVADFGIAARAGESAEHAASTPDSALVSSIAGTPAYMAPEQAESSTIDARADQYSFCISLWEGLCGQRPTEAVTRTAGALPLGAGTVPHAEATGAPPWLLRAVARGFRANPDDRWPSMTALISHIERRLARPRKLATMAIASVLVGATAAAVLMLPARASNACPDPSGRIAKLWGTRIREQMHDAFVATGAAYAEDSFARVAKVLDRYTNDWRSIHLEACRASLVEHTQSSELYDRRRACLDRHLDVVRARTDVLLGVDSAVLPQAVELVASLPPLAECQDTSALLSAIPMPSAAGLRRRIVDLERRIHDIDSYAIRHKPKDVLEQAIGLAAEARALGHPPTIVMALRSQAHVEEIGRATSEVTLRELAAIASTAKDDAVVTEAWARLIYELARQQRFTEARALEPVAEAALTRAGTTPELVFRVNTSLGGRAVFESDMALAKLRFEKALAAASEPSSRRTALKNLGLVHLQAGDPARALELVENALAAGEGAYGAQHPLVAETLVLLAQTIQTSGDATQLERAETALTRALDIRTAAFGEASAPVANVLSVMATLAKTRGDNARAETYLRRAVDIFQTTKETAELAIAVRKLADAVATQRGIRDARSLYERALELSEKVGGKKDFEYVAASLNFSVDLVDIGDCVTARAHADNAIDVLAESGHPALAIAYQILGKCELAEGHPDAGFDWLEQALDVCTKHACWTGSLEDMQFYLGTRLVEMSRDRKRGIALVKKSRDGLKAIGRDDDVKEIEKWLAKHAK